MNSIRLYCHRIAFIITALCIILFSTQTSIRAIQKADQSKKAPALRIGYWSSWKKKCGIAVYTEHLYNSLKKAGYTVFAYPNTIPVDVMFNNAKRDKLNILNIQYEPALWHYCSACVIQNPADLFEVINAFKHIDIKVILTIHNEPEYLPGLVQSADALIYHKPSLYFAKNNSKIYTLPMAVPVFTPSAPKDTLRKKYGFSSHSCIVTTAGFMAPWKEHDDMLKRLVPWLKSNPNNHIQLLTSFNNIIPEAYNTGLIEKSKIEAVIKKYDIQNQVTHITSFLTQQELSERLWISDLGYLWGAVQSNGSSAASKEFMSARLPMVVTDCSHYHDVTFGAVKTPQDKAVFIKTIITLTKQKDKLYQLRQQLQKHYEEINCDNIIKRHIKIFEKLLTES